MRQGRSWVEILAVLLVCLGLVFFLLTSVIGDFAPPPAPSWLDARSVELEIFAIFGAILCLLSGLSLFLVRPLVSIGPRAPFWLLSVVGVAVFIWRESACRALSPGDIRFSNSISECRLLMPALGLDLIILGVVVVVRQFEIRKYGDEPPERVKRL
jgi:hypothetical protein